MTSKVSQETVLPDPGTPEFAQLVRQLQQSAQQHQQSAPSQQQQQHQKRRVDLGGKSVAELRMLSDLLDDVQDQLEPLRDKALDEKARLTGFAQCAEAFIQIVTNKAAAMKKRAVEQSKMECGQEEDKEEKFGKSSEKQQPPKKRRSRKSAKEAESGGDDSVEKRRGSF